MDNENLEEQSGVDKDVNAVAPERGTDATQHSATGGICTMVIALNPHESDATRTKYMGWIVGLHMYASTVKHYFNNEYFDVSEGFDAEIDPVGFLNANMSVATSTDEIYKPLVTCRKGIDESGKTSEWCEEYHLVTEMALASAFSNKPIVVVFSDNISYAVPTEFNREYDKFGGDPKEFVGLPVCFYFGNVDALTKATNCTYCMAMLRTNTFAQISHNQDEDCQLILMYGNEDSAKNDEYGYIHYVPLNSRSETDKYLAMSGEVDKILINMFIRFMNGNLTPKGVQR